MSQTTVAKYIERRRAPPSPTWRTFLTTHVSQLASIDFFTVPTAIFRVLFALIVLSHDRRRVVSVNVTCHPTAAWTRQQIREAFPWDQTPRYLLRDRDAIYGSDAQERPGSASLSGPIALAKLWSRSETLIALSTLLRSPPMVVGWWLGEMSTAIGTSG